MNSVQRVLRKTMRSIQNKFEADFKPGEPVCLQQKSQFHSTNTVISEICALCKRKLSSRIQLQRQNESDINFLAGYHWHASPNSRPRAEGAIRLPDETFWKRLVSLMPIPGGLLVRPD